MGTVTERGQAIDEALSELADITAQTEAALNIPAPRPRRAASG